MCNNLEFNAINICHSEHDVLNVNINESQTGVSGWQKGGHKSSLPAEPSLLMLAISLIIWPQPNSRFFSAHSWVFSLMKKLLMPACESHSCKTAFVINNYVLGNNHWKDEILCQQGEDNPISGTYIKKTIILNENKSCLHLLSWLACIHEGKWNNRKKSR